MKKVDFAKGPYPGLRPFLPDEANRFFGRDEQIEELLSRLETHRFVAVVGTSGCGKSSVVLAGLLPAIKEGYLSDAGTDWRIARMRPGDEPITQLAESIVESGLRSQSDNMSSFVEATLRRGPLGLVEVVRESGLKEGTNLLLIVDQFEELFRYRRQARKTNDADAFVNLLVSATRPTQAAKLAETGTAIYVVLTMRSDFIGDCALFPKLPEAVNESQFLVPRLTRDQYRAAIVEPARTFGGSLDPVLVNRLLNDLRGEPSQLPLLQHSLMRMWTRAAADPAWNGALSVENYQTSQIADALSDHCDEIYAELKQQNSANPALVQVLFRSLCERSSNARDVRRPATLGEIAAVAGVAEDDLKPVVEAFRASGRSFLMPPRSVPLSSTTVIDISHEAIIRHWRRLNEWVEAEAKSATLYNRLKGAAERYYNDEGTLWRGKDLRSASRWLNSKPPPNASWAQRYGGDFGRAENFLGKGKAVEVAKKTTLVFATAAVLLGGGLLWSETKKQEGIAKARLAQIFVDNSKESKDDDERRLLAIEALLASESIATINWAHNLRIEARKIEPSTDFIETAIAGDVVDKNTYAFIRAGNEIEWRVGGKIVPLPKGGHEGTASIALRNDGSMLALGDHQGKLMLWEREKLENQYLKNVEPCDEEPGIGAVAFNMDGDVLATATSGCLSLWNVNKLIDDGEFAKPFATQSNNRPIRSIGFSQDGQRIAAGTWGGEVLIWNTIAKRSGPVVIGHHSESKPILSIAFHPSKRWLATGSGNLLNIWNLTDPGTAPATLYKTVAKGDSIHGLRYDNQGSRLTVGAAKNVFEIDDLLLKPSALIDALCGITARNLTFSETRKYLTADIRSLNQKTCESLDIDDSFLDHGLKLAEQSSIEELTEYYQKLNDLQGEPMFNAEQEAAFQLAQNLARNNEVDRAAELFGRADASRVLDGPENFAQRVAGCELAKSGIAAAQKGLIPKAIDQLKKAAEYGWKGDSAQCDEIAGVDSVTLPGIDSSPDEIAIAIAEEQIRSMIAKFDEDDPVQTLELADFLVRTREHFKLPEADEDIKSRLQNNIQRQANRGRRKMALGLLDEAGKLGLESDELDLEFDEPPREYVNSRARLVFDRHLNRKRYFDAARYAETEDVKLSTTERRNLAKNLFEEATKYAGQRRGVSNVYDALKLAKLNDNSLKFEARQKAQELKARGLGQYFASRRDEDKALESFRKAKKLGAEINPEAEAYELLGKAYAKSDNIDLAIEAYRKARAAGAQIAPEELIAKKLFREGASAARKHDFDKALPLFEHAENIKGDLSLGKEEAEAYIRLGTAFVGKNKLDQAIEAFKKAKGAGAEIDPEMEPKKISVKLLLEEGANFARKGKLDEALPLYQQAENIKGDLSLGKEEADAYIRLGEAHVKKEELDKAIKAFTKAKAAGAEIDPEKNARNLLARKLFSKGVSAARNSELDTALLLYENAEKLAVEIEDAGSYWNVLCAYGGISAEFQRFEVRKACERAVSTNKDNAEFRHSRAVLLSRIGGEDQTAIDDLNLYIESIARPAIIQRRKQWINELEKGCPPIGIDEVENLRKRLNALPEYRGLGSR